MQLHELDTNPKTKNATVVQVLKDIIKLRIPKLTEDVKQLLTDITVQDITAAEDIYKRHRYPNTRITFGRLSTYDNYALCGLTPTAQAILFLLCRCVSQDNYVAVSIPAVCKEVGIVDKTARQSMQLLRMSGVIALARPAVRHMPAVYMLDPELMCSGKPATEADKKLFARIRDNDKLYISPDKSKETGMSMIIKTPAYMQNSTRLTHDNRSISVGQLTDYIPPALRNKKKSTGEADTSELDENLAN